jgi:signal transduction histidine kinase
MARAIRDFDWGTTPLGPITDWPVSLRTAVGMLLNAPTPMVLLWGVEGVLIYNEGYARFAGRRHPELLGMGAREGWPEIADFNDLNIRRGLAGEAWSLRDQQLDLDRQGIIEPVWLDLDYAPVPDDTGASGGVLVLVTETTARREAEQKRVLAAERLDMALSAGSGIGAWDWDVVSDRVTSDARFARLYGVDPAKAISGAPISEFFAGIHPEDRPGLQARIDEAMAQGGSFQAEYRLIGQDGDVRWVAAAGRASLAPDGSVARLRGVSFDITEGRRMTEALARSEERYRTLFEKTATGFCIVEMKFDEQDRAIDYMIVEGNEAFEEMTGLRDAAGKWVSEMAPGLEQHWFDLYGGVALTGEPARFENPADIFGRWYDVQALRIGEPEARRVAILFNNITERRRTEERLRFMDRLARETMSLWNADDVLSVTTRMTGEHLGVSICAYADMDEDQDGFTIRGDWSAEGLATITGHYSLADFGKLAVQELGAGRPLIVNDNLAELAPEEAATFRNIGIAATICMPLVKDGRLTALMAIHDKHPRVWTGDELETIREVTERSWAHIERVRAEAGLRESEERYRTLFTGMDEGFCIIEFFDGPHGPDSDYIHIAANPAYAANAGIENVVGQTLRELVGDEADAWVERYGKVLRTGEPIHFEQELVATGRWLDLSAFRIEPPERKQVAVLFTDQTDRKRAQRALQALNATLEERVVERTEELTRAHEALRQSQKMEAVGQLTGGIAHDFNNLLAGISGSLELLSKRLREGRLNGVERYIDAAQGAAQRAASLTQRLLAFSRRQTLDPKPTDVNRLISGMEELIRRSVGPDVEVEVVGAGGLWATRIDQSQLENALLNLCINARDAMTPAGGRLTIETANKWLDERHARERELAPGQYVSLCVTDTGSGMTPEVQAQAFDPFFTTKPLGQGTGLGLSMIHGFVRQSGGQVRIYSEPGEGTTMCLYLPRHAGDADDIDGVSAAGTTQGGHGETVLVIDDETTVRMLVAEVLGDAGYHVIEAPDGPSGLEILRSDARIDLLISDVGLPGGMNGRQVADAARETRPDLRVLFITGYAENAAVGNGLLAPGMEVLTKPFVMADLALKVHDMIEGV